MRKDTIFFNQDTGLSRSDIQWVNDKILQFDEKLRGNFNKGKKAFLQSGTFFLASVTTAVSAVFYELREKENKLFGIAGYASNSELTQSISLGDYIIGQCAKSQESIVFQDLPQDYATFQFGDNKMTIGSLLVVPLVFNKRTYGVIELRYLKDIPKKVIHFVNRAANNTAVMMESIRKSEETNAQREELAKQELVLKANIDDLNTIKEELQNQNLLVENALEILSQQKKRIEESINYAKRIQDSILPSSETLNKYFQNSFVIFKPKDLVSGDFYWQAENDKYWFLAVIDCTGHGVPGAFMSMIGNTLLNQIILEKNIFEPAEILSHLHQGIGLNLIQTEGNYRDGMDMMLCRFEKDGKGKAEMVAAGAKSYLFTIKGKEVVCFKGNKQSIGGEMRNEMLTFDQKVFQLSSSSKVILLTDGWIDNANSNRKRYGLKRFREAIKANIDHTLNDLKSGLQEDMIRFQGENEEQRDDITLLGVEL